MPVGKGGGGKNPTVSLESLRTGANISEGFLFDPLLEPRSCRRFAAQRENRWRRECLEVHCCPGGSGDDHAVADGQLVLKAEHCVHSEHFQAVHNLAVQLVFDERQERADRDGVGLPDVVLPEPRSADLEEPPVSNDRQLWWRL